MRSAFTLIELLVVLTIMTLIMGVIVPKGAKLLSSYDNALSRIKENHKLSLTRAKAFLFAEDKYLSLANKKYQLSKKGEIIEISNDNR
jgi:prepilin-type N-terminal cleavage/methylation domain-containing protein